MTMSRRDGRAARGKASAPRNTAASPTRSALKASGGITFVPYFTTLKLIPQMSAMTRSRNSVTWTAGFGGGSAGAASGGTMVAMMGKYTGRGARGRPGAKGDS